MGELQAGQGATGVRVAAPVTGADLRLWGWAAISRGARAISYYAWYPMSSGYESNGYGMIELDGTITDRARAAGEFAGVIARNAALFAPLRPRPSRVAILYNRLSYMVGGNTVAPGTLSATRCSGFYRALFEQNIQVDFIHPDEIVAGRAADYEVVYLSYPLMLQQPVADALKAYVRGGRHAHQRSAAGVERRARLREPRASRARGLDEVFGAREKMLRSAEKIEMTAARRSRRPSCAARGQDVPGSGFAEHLQVTGSNVRVLARFHGGEGVAGIRQSSMSTYGAGTGDSDRQLSVGRVRAASRKARARAASCCSGWWRCRRHSRRPHRRRRGLVEARFLESSPARC